MFVKSKESDMSGGIDAKWAVVVLAVAMMAGISAEAGENATAAEQMAGLKAMCSDTETARAERQADQPLYERLGGYERINDWTREVVRLHHQNDAIKHMFVDTNDEALAKQVADFVAAGTGGPQTYSGLDLPSSHAGLHLTDADFLSAGGDIVTAMQTTGYGQDEIDEMLCILVSLKDQVVFE
jgi:hemoglobin